METQAGDLWECKSHNGIGSIGEYSAVRGASIDRILTKEKERQLDALGFIWDKTEQSWERYYKEAKAFYVREGNLPWRTSCSWKYGSRGRLLRRIPLRKRR